MANKALYRTEIIIWTKDNPGDLELVDLARAATDGDAYCSRQDTRRESDPERDPFSPDMSFFFDPADEAEEEEVRVG